jgi:hypothetical protein
VPEAEAIAAAVLNLDSAIAARRYVEEQLSRSRSQHRSE